MNKLMAGFARVNITPMLGIHVAGYYQERTADGVLDELELNVLALACDDKKAVIISGDLVSIRTEIAEDYLPYISEMTGLPCDAIILHATHTHTGPRLVKKTDIEIEKEYFQMVRRRAADAVKMALEDLKPAIMGWGIGNAPNVAFIRRYIMKDGSVRTNPGVNNPDIVRPIGQVDERVNVVRFDREGADSIVLVNFGNHPDTVGGCKISCDWPGFLRRTVEKTLDNVKCIFVNGAEGDVNHVNVWPTGGYLNDTFNDFDDVSRGYGHARFMGRVMTGGVLQVFDKVKYVDVESLNFIQRSIQIPSNMPAPEESKEFALVMPVCLTNGSQGYFPMKDSYDEGGYEAGSSIFKRGVAELIVTEGIELLRELKSGGR